MAFPEAVHRFAMVEGEDWAKMRQERQAGTRKLRAWMLSSGIWVIL